MLNTGAHSPAFASKLQRKLKAQHVATIGKYNQLDELGLLKFNKGTSNAKVKLNVDEKPEVIFILANHNPRSPKLKTILRECLKSHELANLRTINRIIAI